MNERERRELANEHRGEVLIDSATPIEGRRLGQIVSLRLEADMIVSLRDIANQRGVTVSDLLREGAARIIAAEQQSMRITELSFSVNVFSSQQSRWENTQYTANPVELDAADLATR